MLRRSTWLAAPLVAAALLAGAAVSKPIELIRHKNLGLALLEQEQPAQAAAEFQQVIRLAPADPLGHANLAIALLRQQKAAEARPQIQKAIALAPRRGELHGIMAEVERWSENLAAARAALKQAVTLAPDDVELRYALYLDASGQRGGEPEPALARAQLEALHRLAPQNLVVLLKLGRTLLEAGDEQPARAMFQAVREVVWDADERLLGFLQQVTDPGEPAARRRAAAFVENLLKASPRYQQGIGELQTNIIGLPVVEFEPGTLPPALGDPPPELPIRFVAAEVADGAPAALEPGVLAEADFDNDGNEERMIRSAGQLRLVSPTGAVALVGAGSDPIAALPIDYDLEGDLDLVIACGQPPRLRLLRNRGDGSFDDLTDKALPRIDGAIAELASADVDEDGDLDLLLAGTNGVALLDNQRQGRFAQPQALGGPAPALALAAVDLNADGWADLVVAGAKSTTALINRRGRLSAEPKLLNLDGPATAAALLPFEADNDGDLDLLLIRDRRAAFLRRGPAAFHWQTDRLPQPAAADRALAGDADSDGDLDLWVEHDGKVALWRNDGGHRYHWLAVELEGINSGNTKNNQQGIGCRLEVKAGSHYQMQLVRSKVTHFGLGQHARADLVRVLWTNGVPQNRIHPTVDTRITEKQVLKGSCPFLYAWNGRRFEFITDLLWTAPLGLPLAPGLYAPADPDEEILIRGEQLQPRSGWLELVVTEELWESAYLDAFDLLVVDHPASLEVFSNHKFQPAPYPEPRVRTAERLRAPRAARDDHGRSVLDQILAHDGIHTRLYRPSRWQGLAERPYGLTLELGDLRGVSALKLILTGWIFPTDASINLAIAQSGRRPLPPVLEAEDGAGGWRALLDPMPFPPGKTKTIVLDLDPRRLEGGRLRIRTDLWLHWDRIAFVVDQEDQPVRQTRLPVAAAMLDYHGFSRLFRLGPDAPHQFDFQTVSRSSPWAAIGGRFTRYGAVEPLLERPDGQSVVLGPGDAVTLRFDARALPALPGGWRRDYFLLGFGWDKDADRNTLTGDSSDPPPFPEMTEYPYDPAALPAERRRQLEDYLRRWNTRTVEPSRGRAWEQRAAASAPAPDSAGK